MYCTRFLGFLALALSCVCSIQAATILDLGTLGGLSSYAYDINDVGQIVGYARTTGGNDHAFLWQAGAMSDLGTVNGGNSLASAVNATGQVAGTSNNVPFVWQNGQMNGFGGQFIQGANDINNAGQVVGAVFSNGYQPYVWQNGTSTSLPAIPGGSGGGANAINNSGNVAGYNFVGSDYHAVLWQNGDKRDLGTLGGPRSMADAVNDAGQIVGRATTASGNSHAFLWQNGHMSDLGVLPGGTTSEAFGVSDSGKAVGVATTSAGANHAVLWQNGAVAPIDLNSLLPANSDWILQEARSINNLGQVVGTGLHNGQSHAFELTMPTTSGILAHSVTWSTTANGIEATFVPNGGLTLAAAAHLLGYDHFNWVQIVEHLSPRDLALDAFRDMNGATPGLPFNDPIPGGYRYQGASPGHPAADSLPFYWDEAFSTSWHRTPDALAPGATQVTLFTNDFDHSNTVQESQLTIPPHGLGFIDYPGTPSGDRIDFLTMLVGVRSDYSWDALNLPGTVIRWQSIHGTGAFLQNAIPGGSSDITINDFVDPDGLTQSELTMIASGGGGVLVPEPPTILLTIPGAILMLHFAIRRRVQNDRTAPRIACVPLLLLRR